MRRRDWRNMVEPNRTSLLLAILIGLTFSVAKATATVADDAANDAAVVEETMRFLKAGEAALETDDNFRDVTMFIGNTGTGKSTLTLFVTKDLADLESMKKGAYYIKYKYEDVIGNSTTVSQTIYPKLYIDKSNLAYYDCPGYDDTRNMSLKIAATYFVKRVVDHAASLKFVLVTNYDSVHVAGSRSEFSSLITHLQQFMKNITNYKDSIALVATKVANEPTVIDGQMTLVPDDEVIRSIADFLREYQAEMMKNPLAPFNKVALQLLDILLTSRDNGITYDKIGLFRKPMQTGKLNTIKAFVDEKEAIRTMIISNMVYSPRNKEDFGYTISSDSKLRILKLAEKINELIANDIRNISNEIQKYYSDNTTLDANFQALADRFELGHRRLSPIVDGVADLTLPVFLDRLLNATTALDIPISHEYMLDVRNQERYIAFLQEFSDTPLSLNANLWVRAIDECLRFVRNQAQWYGFLSSLYEEFSSYDFREDLTKYNVANIDDWGSTGKRQGIFIDAKNFAAFAKKQKNGDSMDGVQPTQQQLDVLNRMLDVMLKQQPVYECVAANTTLVVRGEFVRLKNINLTQCGDALKVLNVFALDTVFVDEGIDRTGQQWKVAIVAPRWYIYGNEVVINLNGSRGEDVAGEAANATSPRPGDAGLPGLPGGNAGHFLGIGRVFENGNKLKILAAGGSGGRGQTGGSGFNGKKANMTAVGRDSDSGRTDLIQAGYRIIKEISILDCKNILTTESKIHNCNSTYYVGDKCGSQAGTGGKGGRGGHTGDIYLFDLTAELAPITHMTGDGANGIDGRAGSQGTHPKKLLVKYYDHSSELRFNTYIRHDWIVEGEEEDESCPKLEPVADGGNAANQKEPDSQLAFEMTTPILEYLSYLRAMQIDHMRSDELNTFAQQIQTNEWILRNFTILGFINEVQSLENQFFEYQNSIDFAPYYRAVCQRIEDYVAAHASIITPESRKLFNYLYTAAWGKYLTLNSTAQPNLIIDVAQYLDTTIESIAEVKSSARKTIIDDARKSYRGDIDKKIDEATAFIDTDILPAISNTTKTLDVDMRKLVDEVQKLFNDTVDEAKEYQAKQRELMRTMGLRSFFNTLGFLGSFASILGPYGAAAGAVASTASQIGLGFTDSGSTGLDKGKTIPAGIKTLLDGYNETLKKQKDERIEELDKQLKDIAEKSKNDESGAASDAMKEISDTIARLQKDLDDAKRSKALDDAAVKSVQDELTSYMGEKETLLKAKKDELNADEKKALKRIKKWNTYLKVFQKSFDLAKAFSDDMDKLAEIEKALKENTDKLLKLQKVQESIYSVMWPMLDEMGAKVSEIEHSLKGQSVAMLDLKKWKLQTVIRDTKFQLKVMTKEFEVQDELMHTIQKLDEAFTTLIQIYDRIDAYHDQEKLGDYIAQISSSDFDSIKISADLQPAFLNLDLTINSNVLLAQYKEVTSAFKQTVFPFIARYLPNYNLPSTLRLGNDTKTLVSAAVKQLGDLRKTFITSNTAAINGDDPFIITGTFDIRANKTRRPFFEWQSQHNQRAVRSLLRGEPITLLADITAGLKLNVIKFRRIGMVLRAVDVERQTALDTAIYNFDVRLTHRGNSYYRCDATYFTISNPPQTIYYSNELKKNDEPERSNGVYKKLLNGDFMLSPYAMWTMQLVSPLNQTDSFKQLAQYADHTDVVLVGDGQYVSADANICNSDLDNYYQPDRSISTALLAIFSTN